MVVWLTELIVQAAFVILSAVFCVACGIFSIATWTDSGTPVSEVTWALYLAVVFAFGIVFFAVTVPDMIRQRPKRTKTAQASLLFV